MRVRATHAGQQENRRERRGGRHPLITAYRAVSRGLAVKLLKTLSGRSVNAVLLSHQNGHFHRKYSGFARPLRLRGAVEGAGAAGVAARDAGNDAVAAVGRPVRLDSECGHGVGPASTRRQGSADFEHAWRHSRGGRHAGGAGLPYRPLGSGAAHGRGGEGAEIAGRDPVRGLLHGPLRRPHAGHHGDVRQPALPQRCGERLRPSHPLAADALGRDRRGHLR